MEILKVKTGTAPEIMSNAFRIMNALCHGTITVAVRIQLLYITVRIIVPCSYQFRDDTKFRNIGKCYAYIQTECPTKKYINFQGQYPTFLLNKNHQIYTNATSW